MTTVLSDQHQALYANLWGSVDAYGVHAPGDRYIETFIDLAQCARGTVLDAGCGSGKAALQLQARGFAVQLCDFTREGLVPAAEALPFVTACLWSDLRTAVGPVDYVYCCDVLEHVPLPFTMLTVTRLLEVARRGVFLSIALTPDNFGAWVGQSLHESLQTFEAWRDQIAELGEILDCRDLIQTGLYFVRPRL